MAKLSQVPPKSLRRVMPLTKSTVSARRRAPRSSMSCWGTTRTAWGVSSRACRCGWRRCCLRALVAAAARGFAHLHFRQGGAVRVRAVCILGEHAPWCPTRRTAPAWRAPRRYAGGGRRWKLYGQEKRRATGEAVWRHRRAHCGWPARKGQWLKRGAAWLHAAPPLSMQMQTILIWCWCGGRAALRVRASAASISATKRRAPRPRGAL